MQTAQEFVQRYYSDARCVRGMFGLMIVANDDALELGEKRGAEWPEEAWLEAAENLILDGKEPR